MRKLKYISSNIRNVFTKRILNIINYIILSNLISIHISLSFYEGNANNIIIFNHSKFKSGNFAINKNGDLFIEYYSKDDNNKPSSRLFYGLQKNGRELFFNQSSYTQEINIDLDETIDVFGYNYFDIYNSKNLFISIKNENNENNQYLFSINSYDYEVELHKFSNNINIAHYLWNFNDFFNLNEEKYLFPYEINLLELKKESSYIITFIPKILVNENMNELSFIKKFRFKAFNEDAYEEIKSITYNQYINKTILSTFLMDDKFLVVISVKVIEIVDDNPRRILRYSNEFTLNFYSNNLNIFELGNNEELPLILENDYYFFEVLQFKTIYLKKGFAIFAWISWDHLVIELYILNYLYGGFLIDVNYNFEIYHININDNILIDLVKIPF